VLPRRDVKLKAFFFSLTVLPPFFFFPGRRHPLGKEEDPPWEKIKGGVGFPSATRDKEDLVSFSLRAAN